MSNDRTSFDKFAYLKSLHGAGLEASEYRVLVTVLDYSGTDGRKAFPGVERLVKDCELSKSTVKRGLKSLIAKGFLIEESRGGRGGPSGRNQASVYSLTLPANLRAGSATRQNRHDQGSNPSDQGSNPTRPGSNPARPGVISAPDHRSLVNPHQIMDQIMDQVM